MKVHKKLGNTHLALINFSWATDLDPKGTNNHIKEALDKRCMVDDDDSLSNLCTLNSLCHCLGVFISVCLSRPQSRCQKPPWNVLSHKPPQNF